MTEQRQCAYCSEFFMATVGKRGRPRRFCTAECRTSAYRQSEAYEASKAKRRVGEHALRCHQCDVTFTSMQPWAKYCGSLCASRARPMTPERRAAHKNIMHKRRAAKAHSDVTADYVVTMLTQASHCPLCNVALDRDSGKPTSPHIDHIMPLNAGGTHTIGNIRVICARCNLCRPKDGSDYTGPLTLWSMTHGVITKPEPKAKPATVTEARRVSRESKRLVNGMTALALRSMGMQWADIAATLGYQRPPGAYSAVQKYCENVGIPFPVVAPTHCPNGHPYAGNTHPNQRGRLICAGCRKASRARERERGYR